MPGNTDSDSVIWGVGDSAGVNESGTPTSIPGGKLKLIKGDGTPLASTEWETVQDGTLFVNTSDELYIWNSLAWIGPFSVTLSGA